MPDVVTKAATDEAGRARLRREARVLHQARHPGVVGVVSCTDDDTAVRLTLGRVAGPTLADAPPAAAATAAHVATALARTVADLHQIGIAHRRLEPEHVLLDPPGRPVLCGFGDATDQAGPDDRRRDEDALIDLVELLAVSVDSHASRRERRRSRALRALVTRARRAPAPPTASTFARDLGRVAGHRPTAAAPRRSTRPRTHPLVRRLVAPAIVPVVVVAALVGQARRAGDPGAHASNAEPTRVTAPAAPPVTLPPIVTPTTSAAVVPPQDGSVPEVSAGGARYAAGRDGDRIVVADWTCTGEPSALLLRPATGELWLFATLPVPGETVTAQLLATVVDAIDIPTEASEVPCPPLAVLGPDGSRHEVEER